MKRRELPDLSHVLDDSRPLPAVPIIEGAGYATARTTTGAVAIEKRIATRFDKAFVVVIGSELYGDTFAIARNVSAGGILVEMSYAPPLGTVVTVHFRHARDLDDVDELVARAEVKHHHYLNFNRNCAPPSGGGEAPYKGGNDAASARAVGLRFIEFLYSDELVEPDRIQ